MSLIKITMIITVIITGIITIIDLNAKIIVSMCFSARQQKREEMDSETRDGDGGSLAQTLAQCSLAKLPTA